MEDKSDNLGEGKYFTNQPLKITIWLKFLYLPQSRDLKINIVKPALWKQGCSCWPVFLGRHWDPLWVLNKSNIWGWATLEWGCWMVLLRVQTLEWKDMYKTHFSLGCQETWTLNQVWKHGWASVSVESDVTSLRKWWEMRLPMMQTLGEKKTLSSPTCTKKWPSMLCGPSPLCSFLEAFNYENIPFLFWLFSSLVQVSKHLKFFSFFFFWTTNNNIHQLPDERKCFWSLSTRAFGIFLF